MQESSQKFARLLQERDIIVCAGSGGVGKTTSSAVIGLQAAVLGQKVLVMTIDPARRLANSLGVGPLDNEPTPIPLERFESVGVSPKGEMSAMMLDMKESFDRLVRQRAPDEETRKAILENRLYQYFSTSLSGTQEYAAAERLFELHDKCEWDLIVLDTPPTTHALDFLEAPARLAEAVENKALQWLYKPNLLKGKSGFGLFSAGTSYIMKTLGKFTGTELLEEMSVFLEHFAPLLEDLQERATKVRDLLSGERSRFVVVTSPEPVTRDEATYFYNKLGGERVAVGGFVVNRVHPHWVPKEDIKRPLANVATRLDELEDQLEHELSDDRRRVLAEKLRENAASFYVLAVKDARSIQTLRDEVHRDIPLVSVPFFSRDIHSLSGLNRVRQAMFGAD